MISCFRERVKVGFLSRVFGSVIRGVFFYGLVIVMEGKGFEFGEDREKVILCGFSGMG